MSSESGPINVARLVKPKIVCTMGPATASEAVLTQMMRAGMDCARLNFSHGDHQTQLAAFERVQRLSAANGFQVSTMCDVQGPKIRTGIMEAPFTLQLGDVVRVTCDNVKGTRERFQIRYPGDLLADLAVGAAIFVNDGLVRLDVTAKEERDLVCVTSSGGPVSDKKGCNLPDGKLLSVDLPTPKDREDLAFIAQHLKPDYVAVSFVSSAKDMHDVRRVLADNGFPNAKLCAKIERPIALENLDDICAASDCIMVARGDLGVEIPPHRVPAAQRQIIAACARFAVPCIVATQMLESMITNSRPTRGEVSDVYEAVVQGADAVMLSGETSVGAWPVQAVCMMDTIAQEAQSRVPTRVLSSDNRDLLSLAAPASLGVVQSLVASNTRCSIISLSHSAKIARWLSNLRMPCHTFAFSNDERTVRECNLLWGVRGIHIHASSKPQLLRRGSLDLVSAADTVEKSYFRVVSLAVQMELLQPGDVAVIVSSSPALGHEGGVLVSIYSVAQVLAAAE